MDYYGTTSACAENTHTKFWKTMHHRNYLRVRGEYILLWLFASELRNYLRVRGEYNWRDATLSILGELPPRARRILYAPLPTSVCLGTTSACAENTCDLCDSAIPNGNYLRVRGEYFAELSHGLTTRELPPRARRILILLSLCDVVVGTTSACAENTRDQAVHQNDSWNYLRVRGEY